MTTRVEALQAALAGEHAAVYVFAALAAQTSQTSQKALYDLLLATWARHRDARDVLVTEVAADGTTPTAAAPSYRLPNAAATPVQVRRAALLTEQRATDVYGTLVARTAGGDRARAIRSMDESAVRQLRFQGSPETFPGTGGLGRRGE